MAVAVPTALAERGYALEGEVSSWWTSALQEATPELRWPFSIEVYDNMRHQDAQVASVLRAVTAPIQRTQFRVDGTGCDPKVTELVARDLGLPIVGEGNGLEPMRGRARFSWREHLRLALLMLPFGHMYFEQVYSYDEADGMHHLRKLGPRMHRTIAKINVARDGGLVSIEQYASNGTRTIELEVNRLVAYVLDREGGDWLGTSLLRPAYKNWLLKDRMLRTQAMSVERNGLGIPVYEAATDDAKELAAGEELAASVRAGDDAGATTPAGAKLRLMGVEGDLPDADKPIRYHDEQIARAVLAHFLNLGTQTGSWALGSTFADFFTQSLHAICEIVRDVASLHIVEDLVALNFPAGTQAPRLVFDEIGSNTSTVVQAIAVLVGAGVLKPDEDLELFVRTELGLPPRADVPLPPAPVPAPIPEAS